MFLATIAFLLSTSTLNFNKAMVELKAHQYDLELSRVNKIINCESGFRHEGIWGDSGKAYGILQFHRGTFETFKKIYGKTWLKYESMEDQLDLGFLMMKNDLYRHWTCDKLTR